MAKKDFNKIGRSSALNKKYLNTFFDGKDYFKTEEVKKASFNLYRSIYRIIEAHENLEPISAKWMFDNYYLVSRNVNLVRKSIPQKVAKKLPAAFFEDKKMFQVQYVAEKYLEEADFKFEKESLIDFVNGYQQIYPLKSLEIAILPIALKYVIIENFVKSGTILLESLEKEVIADDYVRNIQARIKTHEAEDYIKSEILSEVKDPSILKNVLEGLSQLSDNVEVLTETIENRIFEENINLKEFTKAEVLAEIEIKNKISTLITSLRKVSYVDWEKIHESISILEKNLLKDPSRIYPKMDKNSRNMYRHILEKVSDQTFLSESEVSRRLLNLCRTTNEVDKTHVGYYLVSHGKQRFLNDVNFRPNFRDKIISFSQKFPLPMYLGAISAVTLLILTVFGALFIKLPLWIALLVVFPASQIGIILSNYFYTRLLPPSPPPKLDFDEGVPNDAKSMVVVPCMVSSKKNVDTLSQKIEKHYLQNKDASKNIFFALLSDFTDSPTETRDEDEEIVNYFEEKVHALNKKYGHTRFHPFYLFHRKRVFNKKENYWMGWERKRGKLVELNRLLTESEKESTFTKIVGNLNTLKKIKYIITLDEDTLLPVNAAQSLIGAMEHPINSPKYNSAKTEVIDGYAIMQPRVDILPEESIKTYFSKLFVQRSGFDSYSNAISNIYQDLFGRTQFMGKGIFSVEAFERTIQERFPENTLLSHDMIESCFARTGYISDIVLLEDFPTSFGSFKHRSHRWIRGDWQLLPVFFKEKLTLFCRWLIVDNLRRSIVPPAYIALFLFNWFFIGSTSFTLAVLGLYAFDFLFSSLMGYRVFEQIIPLKNKLYILGSVLKTNIGRLIVDFAFLLETAGSNFDAIVRTLWRLIRQKKLLQWSTHSQVESRINDSGSKNNLLLYPVFYVAFGAMLGLFILYQLTFLNLGILALWLFSPILWNSLKRPTIKEYKLNSTQKDKLYAYAQNIWKFFDDMTNRESSYLPPDNVQYKPFKRVAQRTSPTNIGLYLISVISAFDLKIISLEEALKKISRTLSTVEELPKYKGHLYNWYDTLTLQPLGNYISTVDSGNFVANLILLEEFLKSINDEIRETDYKDLVMRVSNLYEKTDFTFLYDPERKLFSIGFNKDIQKLDESYYDILASEARTASYVAIALGQVPAKHWFKLSRPLSVLKSDFFLLSWGGTMFEYLLPSLWMREKRNTLIDTSNRKMLFEQFEYARENGIPWGISESSYNSFDFEYNYQYRMIGVPSLALKRYEQDNNIVSSYSTFLAMGFEPEKALDNFYKLEDEGMVGEYGFYESLDYNKEKALVKIYLAHHQGMSLLAINNILNSKILVDRFHANPHVKSAESLLEEAIPVTGDVVYEKFDERPKLRRYRKMERSYTRSFTSANTIKPRTQVYSNGKFSTFINNSGSGFSKYKKTYLNRYSFNSVFDNDGSYVFIKDVKSDEVWSCTYQPLKVPLKNYRATFYPYKAEFEGERNNLHSSMEVYVPRNYDLEIRELSFTNTSNKTGNFEFTTYQEVMLDEYLNGIMHPAFNKLFVETMWEENVLVAKRRARKPDETPKFVYQFIVPLEGSISEFSYETSRYDFLGRGNSIESAQKLRDELGKSNGSVLDPVLSIRTKAKIRPNENVRFAVVTGYTNSKSEIFTLKEVFNQNAKDILYDYKESAEIYSEAARNHLNISVKDELVYQRLGSRLLNPETNMMRQIDYESILNSSKSLCYRFGISGENKMVSVRVRDDQNLELIMDMVKFHEYFRSRGFLFDLVFLLNEDISYDPKVTKKVNSIIDNSLSNPYKNQELGVYVLNQVNMSQKEIDVIIDLSQIYIDTELGSIEDQISLSAKTTELIGDYFSGEKSSTIPLKVSYPPKRRNQKLFDNGYGGFVKETRSYDISLEPQKATPLPWSNILANSNFGTLVTESGLGYTWKSNSQMNKITPWSNDFVEDTPGEIIYIKDEDTNVVWTPTYLPSSSGAVDVTHGKGYTSYLTKQNNIETELTVFVPREDPIKVCKLVLRNDSNSIKRLKISGYVEWVLGDHKNRTNEQIRVAFDTKHNYISAINPYNDIFPEFAFLGVNTSVSMFTNTSREFFGRNGSLNNPAFLSINKKKSKVRPSTTNCGALLSRIKVDPKSQVEIIFVLGQAKDHVEVKELTEKYYDTDVVNKELQKVENFWEKTLNSVQVRTPDEKFDLMVNDWLLYQVISSRIYAKAAFYQAGGAFGFRDQLQDAMALIFSNPEFVRDHILKSSRHQFIEGDVQHWWHEPTNAGVRTKITDDLLWLPYVVDFYIKITGDTGILEEETPYIKGPLLAEHQEDLYIVPEVSDERGTILDHCLRAIDRARNYGQHNLPLIGTGDWNDGLNSIGDEGRGESIWLGWFLYANLVSFTKILESRGDNRKAEEYGRNAAKLKHALNTEGWDEEWYLRAYHDDGSRLGSYINKECKIDSISQSWSVISGAGDKEKTSMALNSHKKHLEVDEESMILLLTPSFKNSQPFPGYIQGYPTGIRENGGQYTHGVVWAVKAFIKNGDPDHAYHLYKMLNPVNHSLNQQQADKYKTEPYVMTADIYSNPQHYGRGGWSWYTGSAGWMYQIALIDILGLQKEGNKLYINPEVPSEWNDFDLKYQHKNTTITIKAERNKEKFGIYLNGEKVTFVNLENFEDEKEVEIRVYF